MGLALGGCGQDHQASTKTVTVIKEPPKTVTTQAPATAAPPVSTPASPPPSEQPLSAQQAAAVVLSKGFTASNPAGEWRPKQTLRVLVGFKTGSADGRVQHAFFFVGARYIGTDTSDPSAAIRVTHQEDSTVTLRYALYRRKDPLCCPTGGTASVRFHWNGSRLVPLDPIPTSSSSAPLSR
jgi:hypothetical protein